MELREPTSDDALPTFEWVNDPITRANSALTRPIELEEHLAWFRARLTDPNSTLFIAESEDGAPLGIVRFQAGGAETGGAESGHAAGGAEAEIGINVAPEERGSGVGTEMIVQGCRAYLLDHRGILIVAYIRPQNLGSRRAFAKAGFAPAGERIVRGSRMMRFEYEGSSSVPDADSSGK